MTLAGLPPAGAIAKPHDYKQNVQKMKNLLKKWVLTGNSLKISSQKNQKIQSSHGEQNKSTTRLRRQKLNMNHVARKNLTEAKLKKGFRMNCSNFATLELRSQVLTCSTFIWSRLVMTWPMTLAGLPRAGAISKPHDYKQNVQKWRVSEKMSLNGETGWRFQI